MTVCLLVGWPVGAHESGVNLQLGEASRLNCNTYKRMVDIQLVLDHMSGHLGLGVKLVTRSTGKNWVTMC